MPGSATLRALLADITTLEVDAIVNAANPDLAPGGGVCGAIHQAAGPQLASAGRGLGGCETGTAKLTPAFDLPARFVIHAVGPVWEGGAEGEASLLAACYQHALQLAQDHGLASIAFPAISTGVYRFPPELATRIAVTTVRASLPACPEVREVIFCCFSEADLARYEAELDRS